MVRADGNVVQETDTIAAAAIDLISDISPMGEILNDP